MSLLDSDGPCYDPDLYASLGDDARKAARENAVTEAYEGMDPYEVRLEAERLIGEDRVPTDILREIVRDFGDREEG